MKLWEYCEGEHAWFIEGKHLRCSLCGASGYECRAPNPFTKKEAIVRVAAHKCPKGNHPTTEKNKLCPNCAADKTISSRPLTEVQEEILTRLDNVGPHTDSLSARWGPSMNKMKARGLVHRRMIIEWTITDKGRKALEEGKT